MDDSKPTSTHKSTEPPPVDDDFLGGSPNDFPEADPPEPTAGQDGKKPLEVISGPSIDAMTGERRPFELPIPSPDAPIIPAGPKSRGWLDFGLDTGPRLRVKGLRDLPGPPPPDPETEGDPGDWRERHRKYKQARADGDDRALSKLMPQVLDELHSGEQKPRVPPFDWALLEPAFVAELREWGRANRFPKRLIGFQRFFDGSCAVRVPIPGVPNESHEIRIDKRSAVVAWTEAKGDPRRAAGILGERMAGEFATAKIREVISVPDPEVPS